MTDINVGDRVLTPSGVTGTVKETHEGWAWVIRDSNDPITHRFSQLTPVPRTVTKEIPVEVWAKIERGWDVQVCANLSPDDCAATVEANQEEPTKRSQPVPNPIPETPKQFRKKPVVIEAMQVTERSCSAVCEWIDEEGGIVENSHVPSGTILISTLEGILRADHDDWIIRGVQGEFYPVKSSIFEETYEPA